jgi:16S rRNA processing protein RimM
VVPTWDEMAVVARVARPHGLRGEVVLNSETDFPSERFRPGNAVYLLRGGNVEALTVRSSRFQRERPIVSFDGIETIEGVESFAGLELRVPSDALAPLPDGAYYRHDLVGCVIETGDGTKVGPVVRVEGSLAASMLVAEGEAGEVLIPLVGGICRAVDVAARRIVVDAPDGLLDLNVTKRSLREKRGRDT